LAIEIAVTQTKSAVAD